VGEAVRLKRYLGCNEVVHYLLHVHKNAMGLQSSLDWSWPSCCSNWLSNDDGEVSCP